MRPKNPLKTIDYYQYHRHVEETGEVIKVPDRRGGMLATEYVPFPRFSMPGVIKHVIHEVRVQRAKVRAGQKARVEELRRARSANTLSPERIGQHALDAAVETWGDDDDAAVKELLENNES